MIEIFFDSVAEAIRKEEAELNRLFSANNGLYQRHHHGVCILYETSFVYLIFKELLRRRFPLMVYWEYPYPGNKKERSDLAFVTRDGVLATLVEFKLWTQDHDREIQSDIHKLKREAGCRKLLVVIGYGGEIEENNEYLLKHNPELRLVDKRGLATSFFQTKRGRLADNALNLFLYEILCP